MGLLSLGLQTKLLVRMSVMRPTPARLVSQGLPTTRNPRSPEWPLSMKDGNWNQGKSGNK